MLDRETLRALLAQAFFPPSKMFPRGVRVFCHPDEDMTLNALVDAVFPQKENNITPVEYYREDCLTDKEFASLYNDVYRLVNWRAGRDADGDSYVQVILLQRNRHEFFPFSPLPRLDESSSEEDMLRYADLASLNLRMASDQMTRAMYLVRRLASIPGIA